MSKNPKPLLIIGAVICLSVASTITAFAGWEQTGTTWKYQNTDKTYLTNTWSWIDGNGDGIAECYYFNADGLMLASTITPDNYMVNENGAWVVNGEIQTKSVGTQHVSNGQIESGQTSSNNQSADRNNAPTDTGSQSLIDKWNKQVDLSDTDWNNAGSESGSTWGKWH